MENNKITEIINNIKDLKYSELIDMSNQIAKLYGHDSLKSLLGSIEASNSKQSESGDNKDNEPKICNVVLHNFDTTKKIAIIKQIKLLFKCTAMQAKEMSERLPLTLKTGLAIKEADALIEEWKAIGATIKKE